MKICMIFLPLFSQDTYGMDALESEMIIIFSESQANLKPTRSVIRLQDCMLVAFKKHKLCQPTFEKYVSRPSRDRDVETETTTLIVLSVQTASSVTLSLYHISYAHCI